MAGRAKYVDHRGYVRYESSDQLVHRRVVERRLGRRLTDREVVHHIDRDKQNNHPSNLKVYPDNETHLREAHGRRS